MHIPSTGFCFRFSMIKKSVFRTGGTFPGVIHIFHTPYYNNYIK